MSGKYVGNRPIKLRKSNWKERIDYEAVERQKVIFPLFAFHVLRLPFLLAQYVAPTHAEIMVFLTEPKSEETKAFEEECIAQVNWNLFT